MQKESGYYYPGTEFDPQAPWNQDDTAHEKAVELAEFKATAILNDGTELRKFDADYELFTRISWHLMAEAVRDLGKALQEDDMQATQRVLHALEKQRIEIHAYVTEQLTENN